MIIISTALPAAKIRSDVRSGSENSVPLQCRYSCPAMTVQKMKSLIYINIVYINIHIFGIMLHNIIILKSDQFNKIFDILSTYTIFFFFIQTIGSTIFDIILIIWLFQIACNLIHHTFELQFCSNCKTVHLFFLVLNIIIFHEIKYQTVSIISYFKMYRGIKIIT